MYIMSEIPGFLSEEECRVVVQLAQLKGLMESQTPASNQAQDESNEPLLSLSTEEIFSLLDLNQDGLLQKYEVKREKHLPYPHPNILMPNSYKRTVVKIRTEVV